MSSSSLQERHSLDPIALVVHPEEDTLAYISDALEMFEPGFMVATAKSLAGAEAWIESIRPDLILVSVDAMQPDELEQFLGRAGLPMHRLIVMGGSRSQLLGGSITERRPTLSGLRKVVTESFGAEPRSDGDSSPDLDSVVAS